MLCAAVYAIANSARGDYRLGNFLGGKVHTRRLLVHWHGAFLCLLAVGFLTQLSVVYSRAWIVLFYVSGLLLLVPLRRLLTRATLYASRNGIVSAKKIFVVGATPRVSAFLQRYQPSQLGVEVAGCCFLPLLPGRLSEGSTEVLTRELEFALIQAREANPDAIVLLGAVDGDGRGQADRREIRGAARRAASRSRRDAGGVHQCRTVAARPDLDPATDVGAARNAAMADQAAPRRRRWPTVALVLLTPLLAVVTWLVQLDGRGPAFFRQRRYGYNQETFWIVKFRTMRVMEDGPNVRQATRDDDRVTRLGCWLRRWNIDELPQLLNVIKGDMSLVGPRPHALSHNLEYEKKIRLYARRHNVKPGITGWAQVHGFRGETDATRMRKRVEYDLYYIENWSLWLDIQILVRTVLSPKSYRNAY